MGYKIDSDILFGLIHSELKTVLSPLYSLISDDRTRHFEIAIGGIIKKAGELTDAEANSSEKPNDSDTISRQAAIDEVQAIEHLATLRDGDVVVRMNDVEHILYTMPSAQPERKPYHEEWVSALRTLPEIIRCRECREFRRWIGTDTTFCDRTECETKEDDFCSRAERRTDEGSD